MKRGDWLLMGCVALLAGAALLWILLTREDGATVVVEVDGIRTGEYLLSEDQTVILDGSGGTNLLVIKDRAASVAEAGCPDQLCVRQPDIRYQGQTIVCLPHRVVIYIEGGEEADVDGVAG